jgi:hypothetical protein
MKPKFYWKSARNKNRHHLYVGTLEASIGSYDPIPTSDDMEFDQEYAIGEKYGRNDGFRVFCTLPGSRPNNIGGFATEEEAQNALIRVVTDWFKSTGLL